MHAHALQQRSRTTACVLLCIEAVEVWQVMMRMSPSGSKRHRVKRMSTFSGQALPDQDGKPYKLLTSNSLSDLVVLPSFFATSA